MSPKVLRVFRKLLLAAVVLAAAWFIRHQNQGVHHVGWTIAGWALTALVVVRVGLALRRGHALVRQHASEGLSIKSIDQVTTAGMPAWMRGAYGLEKRMYAAAWRALSRKDLVRSAEFSVAGGPRSARMFTLGLALVLVAACAALLALLQSGLPAFAAYGACGGVLFATAYLLAWLAGSRRLLRESGHDITLATLALDLGLRASARVPMTAIGRALHPSAITLAAPADVWMLAPFERPNVLLKLARPVAIEAVRFGYPVTLHKSHIALYVDEPARFVSALEHALPGSRRHFA
jgi:hypothetical protein